MAMELAERQRCGALVLVIFSILMYLGKTSDVGDILSPASSRHADITWGETVVELSGDTAREGIYFIPRGSKVRDLLAIAGWKRESGRDRKILDSILKSGTSVQIVDESQGHAPIRFGRMSNAHRFALDMPIGLNAATADDLRMVRGIGEKTADEIVRTRTELGRFRKVDDLLYVKGIGPKKLETFRRSFYIE